MIATALQQFSETRVVRSHALGELVVATDEVIEFPAGLVGMPEVRAFVLLATRQEGLFWLQAVDHPEVAFVLADPFRFCPGYELTLEPRDLAEIGADGEEPVLVLSVVTLPGRPGESPTANLQGPVALCIRRRTGKQVVLGSSAFGVRHPISLEGTRAV